MFVSVSVFIGCTALGLSPYVALLNSAAVSAVLTVAVAAMTAGK